MQLRDLRSFGGGRGGWLICAVTVMAAVALQAVLQSALGHDMGDKDAAFVRANQGAAIIPFIYLGAKHMATGYDHLLFILAVILALHRMRDVVVYVTLFSLGHSTTLLLGALMEISVNAYLVDAVIGMSVVYIAFDKLGGFRSIFGVQPNSKLLVAGFGLVHGFGLATKLQALGVNVDGLLANILAFNVGVEIGQILVLSVAVALLVLVRRMVGFQRVMVVANALILTAGVVLTEYQLAGYFYEG